MTVQAPRVARIQLSARLKLRGALEGGKIKIFPPLLNFVIV